MLPRQKRLVRAATSGVVVALVSAVVAVLVRWVAITKDLTVPADGQSGIRHWEVARSAFARGDGFPLWDRNVCAGLPYLGNPDTQLVSSLFAGLFRVHGDVMARWYPTVALALAVAGTFLLCRALKLSWIASIFAGALFASSGFVGLHTAVRATYVPLALIPWVLWLAREGERDVRAAAGSGAVLGLMLLEGGLVPFCFGLVAMFLMTVPRAFTREAGPVPVLRLIALAAVACFLISGLKLFPTLAQLMRAPRSFVDLDQGPWADLIPMLGDSDRAGMPGRRYHVNEFRGYIGPFAFGMAIAGAGVSLILKPRRVGLVLMILGTAALTRGHFADYAPWALLTKITPFNQLQVPARFVAVVDLGAAAAAAIALDAALRAVKRPLLWVPLLVVAVLAVADPISAGRKIMLANIGAAWLPRPDPKPGKFHLVAEELGPMATFPARNVGVVACPKPWPYPEGNGYALGDVPQAAIDGGTIASVNVQQNGTVVELTAMRPATVRLNQNFDPDFVANIGEVRKSARGTLDVQVPAGTHRLEVRYRPKGLVPGVIATVIGVALIVATFVWERRRRAR